MFALIHHCNSLQYAEIELEMYQWNSLEGRNVRQPNVTCPAILPCVIAQAECGLHANVCDLMR